MKSKALLFSTAALVAAATFAHAADGTWNGGAGTWNTTDTNWTGVFGTPWDSTNGANNKAIFGGTAGTVTLTSPVFVNALQFDTTGYTIANGGVPANTLTLAGTTPTITTGTGVTATISSVVAGSAGLTKTGAGTLTLSGANTYTGATLVNAGTLVQDMTARPGTTGAIGAVTVASGAVYELLSGTNATADSTLFQNNTFSGAGTIRKTGTGYIGIAHTGSNTNGFSGTYDIQAGILGFNNGVQGSGLATINLSGAAAKLDVRTATVKIDALTGVAGSQVYTSFNSGNTLSLGNNNGSGTFNGAIVGGTANLILIKNGTGTQTFTGANTYSGGTIVNGGVLNLDFSATGAPTTNILLGTGALTLGGGNLTLTGKANTTNAQTVSGLTLTAGTASSITLNANATANPLLLTLNGITRNAGSTIDFTLPTGTQSASNGITTTTGTASTLLAAANGAAYATVGGTDWAAKAATGNNIVGLSTIAGGYTNFTAGSVTLAGNADLTGAAGTYTLAGASAPTTVRSLVSGNTVDLNGNILGTGGILANGDLTISGATGNLTAATGGGELVLNQSANTMTVSAVIADNGTASSLTKAGAGTLILSGANTYTGKTYLGAGVTQISADNNFGTAPGAAVADQLTFGGGTLRFGAATTLSANRGVTLNGSGGTIDTNTFNANIAGAIAGTGTLTKNGTGTLTLSGANTYTGTTNINAGVVSSSYYANAANSFLGGPGAFGSHQIVNIASGAQVRYDSTSANSFLHLGGNVATGGFGSFYDFNISGTLAINDGGAVSQILQSTYNLINGGVITNTGTAHTGNYGLLFGWSGAGGGNINTTGTGNQITADRIGFYNGATITTNAGSNLTISSVIGNWTSTTALNKTGAGTLTLTGANSYTGATTINAGVVTLGVGGTLANTSAITIGSGATLNLSGSAFNQLAAGAASTLTINGALNATTNQAHTLAYGSTYFSTISMNNGTLANTFGQNTSGFGAFFIGANRTITATGTNTISGLGVIGISTGVVLTLSPTGVNDIINVTGTIGQGANGTAGGIAKTGLGTVVFSGINTYTGGTTVSAGTLKFDLTSRTSAAGGINLGAISTATGATLELYTTATGIDTQGVMTANFTGAGTINKTGAGYLDIGWGAGPSASIKNFTGQINVVGGALASNASDWGSSAGAMSVDISSGAYLDLRVGNIVIDKLTGSGHVGTTWNTIGKILSVGNNNGSSTFDGVIENAVTGSSFTGVTAGGTVGLTKNGTGTFTLTGTNTYTGLTTVAAGKLLINGNNSAATGEITVATGATLGGTGTIGATLTTVNGNITGGDINTVGTLTATAVTLTSTAHYVAEINSDAFTADKLVVNGALALGSGVLDLTDLGSASVANGTKLTIASYGSRTGTFSNYTEGQVFSLGSNQWQFSYNDGSAITLTAVPEPSTYGLIGAGALAGVAFVRRRRHAGKVAA